MDLVPDIIVDRGHPSLTLAWHNVRCALRRQMDVDEIKAELNAIAEVAQKRSDFGIYGVLGLKPMSPTYGCVYSGESLLNWLHEHERLRMAQLKIALPTQREEAAAARQRVQERLKHRAKRHRLNTHCASATSLSAG